MVGDRDGIDRDVRADDGDRRDDARQRQRVSARSTRPSARASRSLKIIEQLHSACIAPQIAAGPGGKHRHQAQLHPRRPASEVHADPVLSKIDLNGDTLTQSDYASTGSIVAAPGPSTKHADLGHDS